MQIIIPMAGLSERFIRAGYKKPKPLIKIDDACMIEHVIRLFPGEKNFLFICNKIHARNFNLEKILKKVCPSGKIQLIDYKNSGPVSSIVECFKNIADEEPAIVNYCDFNMHWDFGHFKRKIVFDNLDGAVVCYTGFHPHLLRYNFYAGVKSEPSGRILEIMEKHSFTPNKFDSWHSCGAYYFKSGAMMKKYFMKLVNKKQKINGEYYVSMVYNEMIKDGLNCGIYPINYFCQWGTPSDLRDYLYWSEFFLNNNNER
ncbi:MAG: hypothetical protein CEN90_311 [Parcubacteria group bacterium Licking1014_17]|nr:MAG: hypothetical protein CEN90_311 [Parcubacteria group bacterium Licking1014_17]